MFVYVEIFGKSMLYRTLDGKRERKRGQRERARAMETKKKEGEREQKKDVATKRYRKKIKYYI